MPHEKELVELTNMCMIYDDMGNVLVQDRVKSWCGIAFPGGHIEKNESFVLSTIREIKEETGLDITNLELCGVKQWYSGNTRNICFLYKTNQFSGNLISNDEGKNFWVAISDLKKLNLASNFDKMLELFLGNYSEHFASYYQDSDLIK